MCSNDMLDPTQGSADVAPEVNLRNILLETEGRPHQIFKTRVLVVLQKAWMSPIFFEKTFAVPTLRVSIITLS